MTERLTEQRMRNLLYSIRRGADGFDESKRRYILDSAEAVERTWMEDRRQLKTELAVARVKARVFEAALNDLRGGAK